MDELTMPVQVIILTGSMGAGKTTVLGEASDVLSARGVVHAVIDLDDLAVAGLADDLCTELTYANLAAVWANFARAGVTRLLLAEAIESADELSRIRAAIPDSTVVVCRLTAAVATMQRRLRTREPGMLQETFVARAAELDEVLVRVALEDFCVVNDGRPVTEVAAELLKLAGWIER
jgi:thymidylate kinase